MDPAPPFPCERPTPRRIDPAIELMTNL
jgi:hypothetical protein